MGAALRLALSWLTVVPAGRHDVDRTVAGRAIAAAPVIGLLLGLPAAALVSLLDRTGMPGLLAGLITVGLLALATRGMHLDGLADTADGLGSYGPPDRALAVMREGGAGPFGVVSLVIVLGAQATAFGALGGHRWWAVVLAIVAGRVAFAACCVRGVPAARPDGLGALVAGTQHVAVPVAWLAGLLVAGRVRGPGLRLARAGRRARRRPRDGRVHRARPPAAGRHHRRRAGGRMRGGHHDRGGHLHGQLTGLS